MSQDLHILAVHRFFWPDSPPYAAMLKRIVEHWGQDGHRVEVLSSQPSYKKNASNPKCAAVESLQGFTLKRLNLPNEVGRPMVRMINAIRLSSVIVWRALWRRYDVIMISTAPPVIGGFAAALAARLTGARFIYHCMDIHPEVGRISGEFSNKTVYRLLMALDNWSCKSADPVIVLSDDMKNTLLSRPNGHAISVRVINNFSLPVDSESHSPIQAVDHIKGLTVLFAGNIGRFQGLETAIEAMALLSHREDIRLVLMGDGASKAGLEELAESLQARVEFVGHQSVGAAKAAMRAADLGFVSLAPGMYRLAFPSKTMTYLEQGCPLVVSVESESELARDVEAGAYGVQVPPSDPAALAAALQELADTPDRVAAMADAAKRKFLADFSEDVVLAEWLELLSS